MKLFKAVMACVVLALSQGGALAQDTVLANINTTGNPVLGQWYGYVDPVTGPAGSFEEMMQLAEANNVPLFVLWGNKGCSNCNDFTAELNTIQAWLTGKKVLFYYAKGDDQNPAQSSADAAAAKAWCGSVAYPMGRLYWKARVGGPYDSGVNKTFSGMTGVQFTAWVDGELSRWGYTDNGVLATPVWFSNSNIAGARLEAEPETVAATVPLMRQVGARPATSFLVAEYPSGAVVTNTVAWAAGQTNVCVMVPVDYTTAGEVIDLYLYDAARTLLGTSAITYVAAMEKTAHNPRWRGANVGEWTMDLEEAKRKAGEEGRNTLVMFAGTLWCPDCRGAEKYIFNTPDFADYVASNEFYLVVVEFPRRLGSNADRPKLGGPPTLLRHATNNVNNVGIVSGSSYMSRNGITVEEAEAQLAANSALQLAWTLAGATVAQTGIPMPSTLLVRPDWTIAGRHMTCQLKGNSTDLEDGARRYDTQAAMARFEDLLAVLDEGDEEANNHKTTVTQELGIAASANGTLSAVDPIDIFKLEARPGLRRVFTVTGPSAMSVRLSVQGTNDTLLASASGNITGSGLMITTTNVPATGGYLVLQLLEGTTVVTFPVELGTAVGTGGLRAPHTNRTSTVRGYTVTSTFGLSPIQSCTTLEVTAGEIWSMDIVAGEPYRIAGVSFTPGAGLSHVDGDFYTATVTGTVLLTMDEGGTLEFQLWKPGVASFVTTEAAVESSFNETAVSFTLERLGGVSGEYTARVVLGANTTSESIKSCLPAGGLAVTWADGEALSKTVSFSVLLLNEGGRVIELVLDPDDGAINPAMMITVNAIPSKEKNRLLFANAAPAFAKTSPLTVFADECDIVTFYVERANGNIGMPARAVLSTTAGELSTNELVWAVGDTAVFKSFTLSLPEASTLPKGTITVSFKPEGITAVNGRSSVTVQVIACDAPRFDPNTRIDILTTRVFAEGAVDVGNAGGGKLSVARLSGSLPPGIRVSLDSSAARFTYSGIPTKVGTYSAVYQVTETVGRVKRVGSILVLTFVVRDNVRENPASARAHAFTGYPVYDQEAQRITGLLNVSMSKAGRVSAKYTDSARSASSFSSKSWTFIDEDGTLTADMVSKTGHRLVVCLPVEGAPEATLKRSGEATEVVTVFNPAPWSKADPASRYAGYYTVALTPSSIDVTGDEAVIPWGNGYLTLSMNASAARQGRFTYAGKLPNGVSVSGSATLMPYDGMLPDHEDYDYAQLGFFTKKGNKEALSGGLLIQADAVDTYQDYPRTVYGAYDANTGNGGQVAKVWWTHAETVAKTSFGLWYEVYGGYYSKADNLADFLELYEEEYGAGPMRVRCVLPASSAVHGSVINFEPLSDGYPLAISRNAIKLESSTKDANRLSYSFNNSSGIFKGGFTLSFEGKAKVSAKYEGVLLPGWTGCGCGPEPIVSQPFGIGAYWFTDQTINPATGKRVNTIRGEAIDITK